MYSLKEGAPCIRHRCIECCLETKMILTKEDISRISQTGYETKEFLVKRNGLRYLKNIEGKCFFLSENGCNIYDIKPQGCSLYPLIYDLENNVALLDPLCPHAEEFILMEKDIKELQNILCLFIDHSF